MVDDPTIYTLQCPTSWIAWQDSGPHRVVDPAPNGRKWISVDATDLFKLQNLVVQLSTELFDFHPSLV